MYTPAAAPAPSAKGGKGAMVVGFGLIVLGLIGGAALIVLSGTNKEETVKKFARAPVGCTTTLDFTSTGEFTVYLETKGSVADVDGDCASDGTSYDRSNDSAPQVVLKLVDPSDTEVALADGDGTSYSAGSYAGTAIHTVNIAAAGSYQLTVSSPESDFAIAVGGDPEGKSSQLKMGGIVALAAGVVLGVLVLLLGRRGGGSQPSTPAWQPAPQWPQQATVPGYQPAPQPGYGAAPPQWQPAQPPAPPAPPAGQGWEAPHQ
jgi:hypothetical protein